MDLPPSYSDYEDEESESEENLNHGHEQDLSTQSSELSQQAS
jgi:hypothetical protein